MSPGRPSRPDPAVAEALRRLEDAATFLGRDLERTAGEMKELWARLAALERRVARLEQPPEPDPGPDPPEA
jgi:hypothetical protein